jgi:hypothetical protein
VTQRLNWAIEAYLNDWRPVLIGSEPTSNRLWISSTTGHPYTYKNLGTLISRNPAARFFAIRRLVCSRSLVDKRSGIAGIV